MNLEEKMDLLGIHLVETVESLPLHLATQVELYTKQMADSLSMTPYEKEVLMKIAIQVFVTERPLSDMEYFLPFIVPIEKLSQTFDAHQELLPDIYALERRRPIDVIEEAIQENGLTDDTKAFISTNTTNLEGAMLILGFSHYITCEPSAFTVEDRHFILSLFRSGFENKSIRLPLQLFVDADTETFHLFNKIENTAKENPLLRIALLISLNYATSQEHACLRLVLEKTGDHYTELRRFFQEFQKTISPKKEGIVN